MGTNTPNSNSKNNDINTARQLKKQLEEKEKLIRQKEEEIKSLIEEKHTIYVELQLKKQECDFLNKAKEQNKKSLTSRNKTALVFSIFSDVLGFLVAVFSGWSINDLTSNPPEQAGWMLLATALVLFFLNVLLTKITALGGITDEK